MWGYVEADFRRDYGIRLITDLPRMSWREFKVLLDALSPWGALQTNYENLLMEQEEREERRSGRPSASAQGFWNFVASWQPRDN